MGGLDDDLQNAAHNVHRGRWEDATQLILKALLVVVKEVFAQRTRLGLIEARLDTLEAEDRW